MDIISFFNNQYVIVFQREISPHTFPTQFESTVLEYRLNCSISSDIKLSKDIFEIFNLITLDKNYTHILVPWGAVGPMRCRGVTWGDLG